MTSSARDGRPLMVPRRMILTATAVGGISLVLPKNDAHAAIIDPPPEAHGPPPENGIVEPPSELGLVARSEIWNQKTYYEPTLDAATFSYNSTFYGQLEAWLTWLYNNTPSAWGLPFEVYSYGAYVDNSGNHGLGRAFDLARIVATNTNGVKWQAFLGRTDKWPSGETEARIKYRRRYWAVAASLHRHFRHVITYRYNTTHANHIHIDNEEYGTGTTARFDTASTLQVQHVQLVCYFLWGRDTPISNVWDARTRADSTSVLREIGQSTGDLTSQENWWAFNRRSALRGFDIGA
jgi:hypothetical protein